MQGKREISAGAPLSQDDLCTAAAAECADPSSTGSASEPPERVASLRATSIQLQRELVMAVSREFGLLTPGDSKQTIHQNMTLRRKLDEVRSQCTTLEVANEVLQRKLRSATQSVENQALQGELVAVQAELAHLKIASAAEVRRSPRTAHPQ